MLHLPVILTKFQLSGTGIDVTHFSE